MDNNLIYDYCREEKVAIQFRNMEELDMLHGLFGHQKETMLCWSKGGYVSYTLIHTGPNSRTTMQIGGRPPAEYTTLTIDEFFTLALPNKSILDYIK